MKQINKTEPLFFSNFIRKNKPKEWAEIAKIRPFMRTYMLSGLVPDENIERNQTRSEQHFQCAYTGVALDDDNTSSHIDHFRKRDLFPNLTFDWTNLFTSTNNEDYGAKYKDNAFRIKPEDYENLINPACENPDDYLCYSFTGEILIKAKDNNSKEFIKAKTTIAAFNLNEYSLVRHRARVIKDVSSFYAQLSLDELKENFGKFDGLIENVYKDLINLAADSMEKVNELLDEGFKLK